jgi:hypothetical protein
LACSKKLSSVRICDESLNFAASPVDIKLVKTLLLKFVDDIQRGTHVADAGWVSDASVVKDLSTDGLCDVGDRGMRLSSSILERKNIQSRLDDEGQDLLLIYRDIIKAAELEQILNRVTAQSIEPYVISVGLERMLQSSEFPIAPERALQQGIEPDEWQTKISIAIPELTLSIVNRFWKIETWDDVIRQLTHWKMPVPEIKSDNSDQFEKVRGVLEWEKVVTAVDGYSARALGLIWYADDLLRMNQIQAPEGIILVQKKIWSIVEAELGRTREEIKRDIEKMLEKVDLTTRENDREYQTRPIASWVDIIRLPW